jgi:hypothetical protein
MVLFAAVHLYWAAGGTLGLPPGLSLPEHTPLLVIDLLAVPLCTVGALLALALIRPWGRRLRHWWLLAASWATAALLVVHALPAVVEWVLLASGARPRPLSAQDRFSLFAYEPYWLLGGILFGVAAWSYQRGSRHARRGDAGGRPHRRARRFFS